MVDQATPIGDSPVAKRLKEQVKEVLKHYLEMDDADVPSPGYAFPTAEDSANSEHYRDGYKEAVRDINAAISAVFGEV